MTGRPTTWLSNVLVLPGFEGPDRTKFDSDAKFAATKETISLRGRHLEGAVFVDANLRKVDLTGAFLQDANFTRADLREARLGCLDPDTPEIKPTAGCAQLQGATLDRALLQGARLIGARLQGVSLDGADLRGALLDWAMLQGAYISNASFDGASLVSASLDAADFGFAQYDLTPPPTFRGAFLENAKLEGVDIGLASFHGASFEGTSLLGSMLTESCVWHATTPVDSKNGARILVQHTAVLSRSGAHFCDWKSKEFDEILAGIKLVVPAGERRNTLIKRFEGRLNPNNRLEGEDKIAKAWKALAASPRTTRRSPWRDPQYGEPRAARLTVPPLLFVEFWSSLKTGITLNGNARWQGSFSDPSNVTPPPN